MTDEVIGGPCTYGCGDVPGHPGVCLVTKLKPSEHDPSPVKGRIADLERQLTETQARLRKANCDYGDGWLSDDLECGIDVEPWCGKHAVLYYIRASKEAQGKLDEVEEQAQRLSEAKFTGSEYMMGLASAGRDILRVLKREAK